MASRAMSFRPLLWPRALHQAKRFRSQVAYEGHVPLNTFENAFLAVGSAIASLYDPRRHDMIATLSETTAGPFLNKLCDDMLSKESGREILRDRPRLNTQTIQLEQLRALPGESFGRAYVDWLDWCKVTPDTREPVRFIDNPEMAYVMQRYRECHDFYHVITGFPVNVSAELVVKWFEMANFGLPVAALSAIFGPLRLSGQGRRRLLSTYAPWAVQCGSSADCLISVYWEKEWETPLHALKQRLGISEPPISWKEFRKTGPWR